MNRARNVGLSVILFIALVSVWEAGVRVLQVPQFILPAPSKVAEALWRGLVSGVYIEHLYYTLVSTVLGFLLGSALGFGLGTGVAMSRRFEFFLYPYIVMFQSLPKIALAPLIVIWFGLGLSSKIVNAALVAFFPLLVNTIVGLKSADEERVNLMRSLAASEKQIFWMLRLPNALPFVMAGLDVAMIFALIGAIVGEFVGAKHGLGMLIQSMNFTMDVSGQFSVLLILSVVGLILNRCISLIRKRVLFWDPSEKEKVEARGLSGHQGYGQGRGHGHPRRRQGAPGPRRELEAGEGRGEEVGGELRDELRRVYGLHAQVGHHQRKDRLA